jgi:adenylate kinase family enzyme
MEEETAMPFDALSSPAYDRVLIIGNGGSGKTWLAKRMAERLCCSPVHLDDVHWEPGRYGIARDKAVVDADLRNIAAGPSWLIEGVYGWLANIAIQNATLLIFLDLSDEECLANIRDRGIQGGESAEDFHELLSWVAGYRFRHNNWNSFEAHDRLFSAYAGTKFRLSSRESIAAHLAGMPGLLPASTLSEVP